MKKIQTFTLGLFAVLGIASASLSLAPQPVYADAASEAQKGVNSVTDGTPVTLNVTIKNVINVLLYIIGIAAVIMIVIGGLRYVLSGGDSGSTKGAKDTILYAVVGLIVAIVAYAIVNFVITAFSPAPATTPPAGATP